MEFTSADYSQVELRYFADYCGGSLRQAFINNADLHQTTATLLGVERQLGKTVNFALIYGASARKLGEVLNISLPEAKRARTAVLARYPETEVWRQRVITSVEQRGPIPWCKTRAGRIRYIPELNPTRFIRDMGECESAKYLKGIQDKYKMKHLTVEQAERIIYGKGKRLVVNYLVQGGSRDLLVIGMNEYRRVVQRTPEAYAGFSIVTTVHDEVLTQHPEGDGKVARGILKKALEGAGPELGLTVPIVAEPKTGGTWADVK
jgi:DNA polymerase I-like protein with 3'-5' exonuclease and polymerase domains